MAKTQCSISLEPQSNFLNFGDIQAVRISGENANPNNSEMRNVSINKNTKKLLLKSTNFRQKHDDLEKLHFKPQLSVQLQSTASCQTLPLSGTRGHCNKRPHKKASDQNVNCFPTRNKKLGLTGRRQSFDTPHSAKHQQKGDKENLAPSHNQPVSESDACTDSVSSLFFTSQIGDAFDAWRRTTAVDHFGEGKDNGFQLTSHSGKHSTAQVNNPLSCEDLCYHKQPNQVEDENYNKKMNQQENESPKYEAVIVLDSEDSVFIKVQSVVN